MLIYRFATNTQELALFSIPLWCSKFVGIFVTEVTHLSWCNFSLMSAILHVVMPLKYRILSIFFQLTLSVSARNSLLLTQPPAVKVTQSLYRPGQRGFQKVEAPRFQDNRLKKVVSLSALRTSRREYSWYSFLLESESTPGSQPS